jgi:hypothetical protein
MKENNFGIKIDFDRTKIKNNYIQGDKNLLRNILDKKFYLKNFAFFKKYNLLFLNQITTLDGVQILGESFLKRRKYFVDICPNIFLNSKIFQQVREKLTLDNNYDLMHQFLTMRHFVE